MDRNTGRPSTGPSSLEIRGTIRPEELYTLNEFKHRLGFSDHALRAARRDGLRVYYKRKHAYVYGRDWIEHVLHAQVEPTHEVQSKC